MRTVQIVFLESVKKILVIDDEAELTGCIKSILEPDYRVFTGSTGRDGLKLLSKKKVSLVVLDYSLPEGSLFDMLGLDPCRLSPHIKKALDCIGFTLSSQEGRSPGMSLKEIAAVVNISPQHLSTLFRKECGKGFNEIMHIRKVERAWKLLEEGKDIKEIALELGYRNPNNFSRFFKRLTGTSLSKTRTRFE